jgi:hypothetical protein
MSSKNSFSAHKSIFLYRSLPKLPCPPSQREGDLGAVLRTAAAKGYRLLKPIF